MSDSHTDDHHDEWFQHAAGEVVQEDHGSFNATMVFATMVVTMVVVAGVVIILLPYTHRAINALDVERTERNEAAYVEYRGAKSGWDAALYGEPVWVDREAGLMQVPYEIAAERVLREYGGR